VMHKVVTTRIGRRLRVVLFALVILLAGNTRASVTGPDPAYYTYDEVLALFGQWRIQYPDIFHREIIGFTQTGHEPIWAARISDNAAFREPEASILFHAAQHANESNGTNVIVKMMERLLTGYGQDPKVTDMVDHLQIWFVPVVNVDGHRMVFSDIPNWSDWRKNKRDNDENGQYTCPEDGVDLNRNWDFRWAEYDSTDPSGYYYRGPAPFSESEVVAIRNLILRELPVIVMDYHSPFMEDPGLTIRWPWREAGGPGFGPDTRHFQPISMRLGQLTQTEVDSVYYNGMVPSLDVLPKEQCWVYAHTGICILLMEIAQHGWWEGTMVDTIAARVARGSFYLADLALTGSGLTGFVTDSDTGEPLVAEVRVQEAYSERVGPHLTDDRYGRYWRLLRPGDYTLSVSAAGYYVSTQGVTVDSVGWTQIDAPLTKLSPALANPAGSSAPRLWVENPARRGAEVHFRTGIDGPVCLEIFDPTGRRVLDLVNGRLGPGERAIPLPDGLVAGVYLVRLRADGRRSTTRIVTLH
jgi:carboxypeptidase T